MAALRDVEVSEETRKVRRTVSGAVVTGVGLALLFAGLFGDFGNRLGLRGRGRRSDVPRRRRARPAARAGRSAGSSAPRCAGRASPDVLARNNAMRSPKRTASTAAALMVGVALVALMTVLAASTKASVGAVIDKAMRADFVVSSGNVQPGSPSGFSPTLQRRLAALPQVALVDRRPVPTRSASPAPPSWSWPSTRGTWTTCSTSACINGDLSRMTATGVAISQHVADARHLSDGRPRRRSPSPRTGPKTFTVQAIFTERSLAGDYVLPLAAAQRYFNLQLDFQVYVKLAPGVTPAAGRQRDRGRPDRLSDRAPARPHAVQGAAGVADRPAARTSCTACSALALLIALVGIANTLALSIYERTRELGLLRAVGMTRRQLRATVRAEAVIIALLGAVGGAARRHVCSAGRSCGRWRRRASSELSVPVLQLVVVALLAAVAGVVAAAAPGRRAARLDVLRAIAAH